MHSRYFPFPLLGYEHFKLVKENDSETVNYIFVIVNKN